MGSDKLVSPVRANGEKSDCPVTPARLSNVSDVQPPAESVNEKLVGVQTPPNGVTGILPLTPQM